jgi:hypothetical protein
MKKEKIIPISIHVHCVIHNITWYIKKITQSRRRHNKEKLIASTNKSFAFKDQGNNVPLCFSI